MFSINVMFQIFVHWLCYYYIRKLTKPRSRSRSQNQGDFPHYVSHFYHDVLYLFSFCYMPNKFLCKFCFKVGFFPYGHLITWLMLKSLSLCDWILFTTLGMISWLHFMSYFAALSVQLFILNFLMSHYLNNYSWE